MSSHARRLVLVLVSMEVAGVLLVATGSAAALSSSAAGERTAPLGAISVADTRSRVRVQGDAPEPGVDPGRPIPARRDDALGDEATTIGWIVAVVATIAFLGVIAWLWLRVGRATERGADAPADQSR